MKKLERFYRFIGRINEFSGKFCAWLIFPMMALVAFEVIMRYVFSAPTIWTWDVNVQLLAVVGGLSAGYGLLHNSHARVDIFSKMLSNKGQAILGFITDVLTVIFIGWITWYLFREAINSTLALERGATVWRPPVYPQRMIVAFGFLFLTFQAVCVMLQNLTFIIGCKPEAKAVSGAAS